MKRVTMKDVATRAGVSTTTVSHVINNTRHVEEKTEKAVRAAMRELGYRPNSIARSLRIGQTQTVGLVVPDASNLFFADIARRVENIGYENGYSVILCNSDNDLDKQNDYVNTMIAKQVDGVIFISSGESTEDLEKLLDAGISIVVADRDVPLSMADVVLLDNEGAGYLASKHLLELGHQQIACITGPPEIGPSMHRVTGCRRAMEEYGLILDESLILPGYFTFKGGIGAMEALLALPSPPTAVFVLNDMMAIGAISAARRKGYRVPDDISIIGFDNIELASAVNPALTTMAQPMQAIAQIATERLLEKMNSRDLDWENEQFILSAQLVVRESTAVLEK